MFCSNQILIVNGEFDETLQNTIEFVAKFDDKSVSDITGIKSINGKLYLGWIPKKQTNDKELDEYEPKYANLWSMKLTDPLLPPTSKLLSEIIFNWLQSDEIEELYDKIYKEKEVGYWDTPSKGWILTAISDESCDDKHIADIMKDAPTFSMFCIQPTWLEYLD